MGVVLVLVVGVLFVNLVVIGSEESLSLQSVNIYPGSAIGLCGLYCICYRQPLSVYAHGGLYMYY